jgi:hypothetical protein
MSGSFFNNIKPVVRILTTERLFLLILFSTTAIWFTGYNSDVFLHLVTGKHILTTGELPHTDVFSFTLPAEQWVMHEWLYQVFLYSVHDTLGLFGQKVVGAGVLTTILYINKRNCEIAGASHFASWAFTLFIFLSWINFIGLRPHIITFLFFVINLYLILQYRYRGLVKPLYLMPVLMVLWVNSHGGFLVGIILLGYATLLTVAERHYRSAHQKTPWPLISALLLTILASLVNPYGVEQLFFPFHLMNLWVMDYVPEWRTPDFTQLSNAIYLLAIMVFILLLRYATGAERWFRILFSAPFIIASFVALRHLPLAAFVVTPFLASQVSRYIEIFRSKTTLNNPALQMDLNEKRTGFMTAELGTMEYTLNWIVLLSFCMTFYLINPLLNKKVMTSFKKTFPVDATRYLIDHNIQGRMFTTLQYSDYILFTRYPNQKIFYDVRLEIYGKELTNDYMTMASAQTGWQELFQKYAIDFAVIDKSSTLYKKIVTTSGFTQLYEDEYNAILSLSSLSK